jgi:serine/threonine protein kinase
VQEFIQRENLAQEIATQGVFDEDKILVLLRSLLTTLDFIHKSGVVHRDIKLENIIRRTSSSTANIVDNLVLVGFGNFKPATNLEQQSRSKNAFTNDLYSLGICCIHLIIGVSPLELMDLDWA